MWAGPATGAAALPTFRALISADIPDNAANTTGTATTITGSIDPDQIAVDSSFGFPLINNVFSVAFGAIDLTVAGILTGTVPLANGGTHADLSATGPGFLKQATTGANVTVAAVNLSTSDATGTLADSRFPALTGDITTVAGALATTLATVNSNVGSFALATVTVNAKGLVTAASAASTTGSGSVVLATSPTIVTPSIAKLANLTSNGFVKTSGGDGTLSVDTSTYLTANQTITLSGVVTGSGSTAITTSFNSSTGSGAVVLATSPTITTPTIAAITGATTISVSDSATNTSTTIATFDHLSNGVIAASFGLELDFKGQSTTTPSQNMGFLKWFWQTATHASRKSAFNLSVYSAASASSILSGGFNTSGRQGVGINVDYVGGNIDAGLVVFPSDSAGKGLQINGRASQSADLFYIADQPGNVLFKVTSAGVDTLMTVDAVTAAATYGLILDHTGGSTAAGFGAGLLIKSKSTVQTRELVDMAGLYNSPTDASYTTYGLLRAYYMNSGTPTARNAIGWGASGSAALIGFLAAASAPVALQTTYTQTYTTTTSTVNPASTSAFTGQDNIQVGNVYAKLTDLNTLRTDMLMAMQLINQLIDNGQAYGLAA